MKYDDASWHYGGADFPENLPESAGGVHIAMFLAWAVLNGLAGDLHVKEFADELAELRARTVTPTEWFMANCDGKFTAEDLNEEGNRFALAYYQVREDGPRPTDICYIFDYEATFPEIEGSYDVPDDWATFERLAPIIQARFQAWRKSTAERRKWNWRFWE